MKKLLVTLLLLVPLVLMAKDDEKYHKHQRNLFGKWKVEKIEWKGPKYIGGGKQFKIDKAKADKFIEKHKNDEFVFFKDFTFEHRTDEDTAVHKGQWVLFTDTPHGTTGLTYNFSLKYIGRALLPLDRFSYRFEDKWKVFYFRNGDYHYWLRKTESFDVE
ncbi:MAG: hypothetical protein H6551_05475 [Chitinophagales bacterium]|nr:hypothetical protein [Chitinophagaceae bacterium]MCB9064580.1 hypothetical protein [Chitinophagales bacterium]